MLAAHAVNRGRTPELENSKELSDFYFWPCDDPEQIVAGIVRLVKERIPERFGLDPRTDIQILTPMNRTPLGGREPEPSPPGCRQSQQGGPEVTWLGQRLRLGDRVIQLENNYQRDVFNGDIGWVQEIDLEEQQLVVDFDGRAIRYDFDDLDELALAYALTIHKSQGSEYPCVIVPLHTQHFVMLQRNLLYTAITRGRQLVVLAGSRRALELAVRRVDTGRRYTALQYRLQQLAHKQESPAGPAGLPF